jgi:hypothetical protein
MARRIVLIGPQRLQPTLAATVESLGVEGRVAAVTAGWEEREGEDRELSEHLGGRTTNLEVWARVEDVMASDGELTGMIRQRADRLRAAHELYRLRLAHALDAARELLKREPQAGFEDLLEAEREAALRAVRVVDASHLERVSAIHAEFGAEAQPSRRAGIRKHRAELEALSKPCQVLCVAGGHVVVLLHRLALLDVLGLWGERKPIVAWSAGAMALAERVVLFHDDPPQGAGNAEVYEPGLAAYGGLVPLPHARRRLRLHDGVRVGLMARRFAPDRCVALDALTRVEWDGTAWRGEAGTQQLDRQGHLTEVRA